MRDKFCGMLRWSVWIVGVPAMLVLSGGGCTGSGNLGHMTGVGSTAETEFITIVESAKQKNIAPGSKLRDFYKVSYKISPQESETIPYTAVVTVENVNKTITWKLAYEYSSNQWRFLREKGRRFNSGNTEGIELQEEDSVWKHFVTQDI